MKAPIPQPVYFSRPARKTVATSRLAKVNPGLIYCEISGYGRTGPYSDKPGFDLIAQGMSGLMSITGEPGQPPIRCGGPVTDVCAGVLAEYNYTANEIENLIKEGAVGAAQDGIRLFPPYRNFAVANPTSSADKERKHA